MFIFQKGGDKKTKHAKEMFIFRKVWHALFSYYLRFWDSPFSLITDELFLLPRLLKFYVLGHGQVTVKTIPG